MRRAKEVRTPKAILKLENALLWGITAEAVTLLLICILIAHNLPNGILYLIFLGIGCICCFWLTMFIEANEDRFTKGKRK